MVWCSLQSLVYIYLPWANTYHLPGSYAGTSNMLVSNITFANFTGYLDNAETSNRTTSVTCSTREPCYGITFTDFDLEPREDAGFEVGANGVCTYTADDGVDGMSGC